MWFVTRPDAAGAGRYCKSEEALDHEKRYPDGTMVAARLAATDRARSATVFWLDS
jgi:hypothetical protein